MDVELRAKPRGPIVSGLIAPKHAFVSAVDFRLSAMEAEVFALDISQCSGKDPSIPMEYDDLLDAFSEDSGGIK